MKASRRIQTASHWSVYEVEVDIAGAILDVHPFKDDPAPTPLMRGLPDLVRSPLRIDQPYVRAGYLRQREDSRHTRGDDSFVPVSWDQALALVADGLRRIESEHGSEAIYGGSYAWASAGRLHNSPSVLKRFLGLHGGYVDKCGNHSFGAALGVMPYVLGDTDITGMAVPWSSVVEHGELVVMFGGAHSKNMQLDAGGAVLHENAQWIARAATAGVRFVNISPARSDLAEELGAEWLPIRPNTDTALMLALAHTLVRHDRHDRDFLARYCEGYPRFERYLLGLDDGIAKSAGWAAGITGIDAERIEQLALQMARSRTLVTTSWSIQRADHGEQPVWMTVTLAAMLGQIGLPGGGFSLGFGAVSGITVARPEGIPRPTLPLGPNPVKAFVPVGRVADMLLHPGEMFEYDGQTLPFPHIRMIYSVGGNPFHHNANLNRFMRAWRQPELIVVHEPWWNPAARRADIVLPATTTMERNDILATELQRHYIAMKQVIAPVGGARNDFDIFAQLSDMMGFGAAYTEGRDEMGWLRHMYGGALQKARLQGYAPPGFDEFWAAGSYEFPYLQAPRLLLADFRAAPQQHRLRTPSGKIEIFSEQVAGYGYEDCPGHPCWIEPAEWLGGAAARRFPLHMLSNQPRTRLHSQLDPSPLSRQAKIGGREPLTMNPADAAERNIAHGDAVRVFNDRGAFVAAAVLSPDLCRGVVQIATGAWFDPAPTDEGQPLEKHGNPNVVTMDKGTSKLTQSSVAQTALVEVRLERNPPRVSAFDLPPMQAMESAECHPRIAATLLPDYAIKK